MKKLILNLTLVLGYINCQAQSTINGILLAENDSTSISSAHIINLSNEALAITDSKGAFSIKVEIGDTLLCSNVNYEQKVIKVINNESLRIFLKPKEIQLDEVVVTNMPSTSEAFKKQIIAMDIQNTDGMQIDGLLPVKPKGPIPKNYDPAYTNSVGYAINKPISFIVKKLSKSHKEKLKYYQLKANYGQTIAFDKKFNRELVAKLTNLNGDRLTAFIEYLDIDEAFVMRSSDYEIAVHIQKSFSQFEIDQATDSLQIEGTKEG